MTIPDQIIRDLLISQSTASSIAGRITSSPPVHTQQVTACLRRFLTEGLVDVGKIKDTIEVWYLTEEGLERARQLNPDHKPFLLPNPPAVPV